MSQVLSTLSKAVDPHRPQQNTRKSILSKNIKMENDPEVRRIREEIRRQRELNQRLEEENRRRELRLAREREESRRGRR